MNTIRNKVFSGVIFLSFIIIALSASAVIFINQLARSSRGTVTDNYRTVDYSTRMLASLDEMYNSVIKLNIGTFSEPVSGIRSDLLKARNTFESNLSDESANITEQGEKELVDSLKSVYYSFINNIHLRDKNPASAEIMKNSYGEVKKIVGEIYALNMASILRKNSNVEDKARQIIIYAVIAGGLSVIITLFFVLTFPSRIVKPLEDRDAAKTKLISNVSHEMKTPISSINLTIKLLEDSRIGELNREQKGLLQTIKDQSNRLSKVINEILNFAQIETGNVKMNISPARPEDIIDYAATALMMLLSEKNIQLETKIEDDLPSINIDIEKTVWVLVNLLNNAIRYSNPGGKIILSSCRENDNIYFSVKDYGRGISSEDQKKLFSRFSQVGQKSERGWGLGLAISKEFVQAQGGLISVKSNPDEGSEFRFYIPV